MTNILKTIRTTLVSAAIVSVSAIAPAAIADVPQDNTHPGHIGNHSIPGNSGAATTGNDPNCMADYISTAASQYQGIGVTNPPMSTIDFIDLMFYFGDLLPEGWDCGIYVE